MKRLFFLFTIAVAVVCNVQAARVSEMAARQVANQFFSAKSTRLAAPTSQSALRLAYAAENNRFYVYDRGARGGFVVVSGDDRLPQVLGYGESGDFSSTNIPASVKYWMDEMNRQIAYLQSHGNAVAHQPAKRVAAIAPLIATRWDQGTPYNDQCPTYTTPAGVTMRAVTGCVATGVAQVMNYYQWPDVGMGSHSYTCNVNNMTLTELSADYSQSHYRWDLMLNEYDANSSPESCEAVAKLMSDVGISMDMGYGNSSGASEVAALQAMKRYFKYNENSYILNRDNFGAEEWDELLIGELSAQRPIVYCGYNIDPTGASGHCFILDGVDNDGYYHVNWGWGGSYDGNFLVSVLAPSAGMDFKYGQDGFFGLLPEARAGEIEDVLFIRSQLLPVTTSAPLGSQIELTTANFNVEGNMLDTAGYEQQGNRKRYYTLIPMSLSIIDKDGVERQHLREEVKEYLDGWRAYGHRYLMDLLPSLEDGVYKIKMSYSLDGGVNYDQEVRDFTGKELFVKMTVSNGIAHLVDCFLANTYTMDSFEVPRGITINKPFTIGVNISYYEPWGDQDGPTGNVYVSLLKDGNEVATSDLCEVKVHTNEVKTYEIQLMAPAEWGKYDLVVSDESGNRLMKMDDSWYAMPEEAIEHIMILPPCKDLVEDFESMTANSSTSAKDVPGNFTSWSFYKSGVRAPGEGKCNGTNAVMMKKPSYFYTAQPLAQNFFLAQAVFFNPTSSESKYRLTYSLDNGETWETANAFDGEDAVTVDGKSEALATWLLNLTADQPAIFRITMFGGGSSATYVDDFTLYYTESGVPGDVNGDGEVNIADINAIINIILSGKIGTDAADVNSDGEVNIADVNTVVDVIQR